MPVPKIDLVQLDQLVRAGKSGNQIAQALGVSPAAVCRARQRLKYQINKVTSLEKAGEVMDSHLDMLGQMKTINEAINGELEAAKFAAAGANGADRIALQEIIVKLAAEIRKQLQTQLSIVEVWADMKIVVEFQQEVLGILDEVHPGIRNEIIRRLKEKRVIRQLVSIGGAAVRG